MSEASHPHKGATEFRHEDVHLFEHRGVVFGVVACHGEDLGRYQRYIQIVLMSRLPFPQCRTP